MEGKVLDVLVLTKLLNGTVGTGDFLASVLAGAAEQQFEMGRTDKSSYRANNHPQKDLVFTVLIGVSSLAARGFYILSDLVALLVQYFKSQSITRSG